MTDLTITCPKCGHEIPLTESLAAPLVESMRRDYEQRLAQKDADAAKRDGRLREREEALRKQEEGFDDKINERLRLERTKIVADEAKKARIAVTTDIEQKDKQVAELTEVIKVLNVKLSEAQNAQAEVLRMKRQIEEERREIALNIEKQVAATIGPERDKARKEADEASKLQIMERDQKLAAMQKQIEELKRKAEQGSQQLQGEVQELELEALLGARFPHDTIEPVPKGVHGGDVLQRVVSPTGQTCGSILWESKRTRNWTDSWLAKLREDQRAARADLAIIVTQAMPKDVDHFDMRETVWVTSRLHAMALATIARQLLIDVSSARQTAEGQRTKAELLYQYMAGPRFRDWINVILEKFNALRDDLEKERKALTSSWRKREQHIGAVIEATAGMYGDLQGIAGLSLKEIEGLEVKMLEAAETEAEPD